ncbi:hypothetical protein [Lapidilactobacillus wuchangensis]|uniref:hypothetical protein n=1 Tax=Lapidilactobacillus wuchangensis TaxID=2486001 RepID=UPI000F7B6C22|nr:hypothetical protein [Lapidilactobacillus wuchangensis]
MKKLVRALVLVLPIILLAACSNKQGNASALVSSADNAVAKQEFSQASAYFDAANQTAKDSKYATAKKDAQLLATAQEKLTQNNFTSAKTALKQISTKNSTAAIKNAKKQLTNQIDQQESKYKAINKIIASAKSDFKNKKYSVASSLLADLFKENQNLNDFSDLKIKALNLKNDILTAELTTAQETRSTTTENNSANTNSSSETAGTTNQASSTSTANTSSSASVTSNSHDDNSAITDGSVTAAQIKTARQQLRDQGVSDSAWSNSDIAKAILKARADGRSTIKESDAN